MSRFELRQFQREHYAEYAAWFSDAQLNRYLGPMNLDDTDWLDVVLSQPASAGTTWAVFRNAELVAVVGIAFDEQNRLPAAITGIATKPSVRRQGIGTAVLQQILSLHQSRGIAEHIAYVSMDNIAGQRCVEKAGFVRVALEANDRGYIEFRHTW